MKTAFLFPGQGAQAIGMGRDIAKASARAAKLFEEANEIVGFDLAKICFEGPEEALNTTTISQPAIFVTSACLLEALKENPATSGLKPDVTAGLSLGEYTALYAAGVISFQDALILVQKRGAAMQAAADASEGGMVSIIGLDENKVNQLCRQASEGEVLAAVNFNCPGQIVISGSKAACQRAEKLAESYGAIKAVPLKVAGAFHTEMMSAAADALVQAVLDCKISEPCDVKIIANVDARYYNSAKAIREGLLKQLVSAVLWQKNMEKLITDGVERCYEIGPGKILAGLMRKIDRKKRVVNISNLQSIKDLQ